MWIKKWVGYLNVYNEAQGQVYWVETVATHVATVINLELLSQKLDIQSAL